MVLPSWKQEAIYVSVEETVGGNAVSCEKSMKKTRWDSIEMVCEDEDYWFLEYSGIIIDKDVLTPEQYRFIRGKCDAVKEHPKYID